jgi:AcrR family transcriptional regulator
MSARKAKRVPDDAGKAERTRAHILDSALALFRKRGFDKATMRDVAAAAGVALGAAYYYFPSKEALALAYYNETQAAHSARARERMKSARTIEARVAAVMHAKLDVLEKDRRLLGTIFRSVGDPQDPMSIFGEQTRGVRRESVRLFEEALEGAPIDAELLSVAAEALWAAHMAILLFFLHDDSPKQTRTRALVDRALAESKKLAPFAPMLAPVLARAKKMMEEAGLVTAS